MYTIIISPLAEEDLTEIIEYIANDSPMGAERLKHKIDESLTRLAGFPYIGHTRSELTSMDLRFWAVQNYLIAYKIQKGAIEIVRVLHGYRDIASLLEDTNNDYLLHEAPSPYYY